MWHEITHPFPNISGAVVEVWEWISNYFDGLTVHGSLQGPKKIVDVNVPAKGYQLATDGVH